MSYFQRYLQVLECPFSEEITDENIQQVNFQELLILWLEDRKIREYEIEQRKVLKLSHFGNNVNQWAPHIQEYGIVLGSPYHFVPQEGETIPETNREFLFWLISRAVSLDYEDATAEDENEMEVAEFQNLDYQNLSQKCEQLGNIIGFPRGKEEPLLGSLCSGYLSCFNFFFVEYVRKIVQRLKFAVLTLSNEKDGKSTISLNDFPLAQETQGKRVLFIQSTPSDFSMIDPLVNQVALVLRMLYISDFRELQNEVNDLIVLGQEYTANP
jgi:hypothetical protein